MERDISPEYDPEEEIPIEELAGEELLGEMTDPVKMAVEEEPAFFGEEDFEREDDERKYLGFDNHFLELLDEETVKEETSDISTEEVLYKIFSAEEGGYLGKDNAKAANIEKAKAQQAKVPPGVKGKVVFEGSSDTQINNELQKTAIDVMDKVLKDASNIEYHIFASFEQDGERVYRNSDGKVVPAPNGFYDFRTRQIWVDLNAGNKGQGIMLDTIAHEHVHDIKVWSAEHFNKLAEITAQVFEHSGKSFEEAVALKLEQYKGKHSETDYDTAYEEVVAETLSTILRDEKTLAEFSAQVKAKDKTLWEKIKDWFSDIIARITKAYKNVEPESEEGKLLLENKELFEHAQKVFVEGVVAAGKNYAEYSAQTSGEQVKGVDNKNPTEDKDIRFSLRDDGGDPRKITEDGVRNLLEKAYNGEFDRDTYIPVSKKTPSIIIEHLEKYIKMQDLPIIMNVGKVQQMMENDDGVYDGGNRLHGLDEDQVISIFKEMFNPEYIVYQQDNGRGVAVVKYAGGRGNGALAVIDFGSNGKIGNQKNPVYLNGYQGGFYNILVTAFSPDSLESYLEKEENIIVYEKKKGNSQGSSGSLVPSLLNELPFFEKRISQSAEDVKTYQDRLDVADRNRVTFLENKTERLDNALTPSREREILPEYNQEEEIPIEELAVEALLGEMTDPVKIAAEEEPMFFGEEDFEREDDERKYLGFDNHFLELLDEETVKEEASDISTEEVLYKIFSAEEGGYLGKDSKVDDVLYGKSTIVNKADDILSETPKKNIIKLNMQFFAEKDLDNQSSKSLRKGIRNLENKIELHNKKLSAPQLYDKDWINKNEKAKRGLKKHWAKEKRNFEISIQNRIDELKKRGDYND